MGSYRAALLIVLCKRFRFNLLTSTTPRLASTSLRKLTRIAAFNVCFTEPRRCLLWLFYGR
jgi:hypothetical protein